jgi:SnoaL-like polyketide cyclase
MGVLPRRWRVGCPRGSHRASRALLALCVLVGEGSRSCRSQHSRWPTGPLAMLWFSSRARHIGSAFPRFAGRKPTGQLIIAKSVRIFRIADGKLAEHWAVRDDLGVLRQMDGPEPAEPRTIRDRPTFRAAT